MIKIAIIVGHTEKKPGAMAFNGVTEYEFNKVVADLMVKYSTRYEQLSMMSFYRDHLSFKQMADIINKTGGVDLTIELHFNSSVGSAKGCEVLIYGDDPAFPKKITDANAVYADIITNKLSKEYGIKNRGEYRVELPQWENTLLLNGIKVVNEDDRGGHNLKALYKEGKTENSLLIEPCFAHMETEETKSIIEHPTRYAEFLVKVLAEDIFNLKPILPKKEEIKKLSISTNAFIYKKKDGDMFITSGKVSDEDFAESKLIAKVPLNINFNQGDGLDENSQTNI